MSELTQKILDCRLCDMCHNNLKDTNPVPGIGPVTAKLVLLGECPSTEELIEGKPFVGRCGKLLRQTLKACGIKEEEVYISNVIKCASRKDTKNVPSTKEQQKFCGMKWLSKELVAIKPLAIMTLGQVPLNFVTDGRIKISKKLGEAISSGPHKIPTSWGDCLVYPNYHPSFILQHGKVHYEQFVEQIRKVLLCQKLKQTPPKLS